MVGSYCGHRATLSDRRKHSCAYWLAYPLRTLARAELQRQPGFTDTARTHHDDLELLSLLRHLRKELGLVIVSVKVL